MSSSSTSRTNTYPIVTTKGIQTIPAATQSASSSSSGNNQPPTAAIVVACVFGALIAIFIGYRIYVFIFRRYAASGRNPLPDARPLAGQQSPGLPTTMSMAFNGDSMRSTSALGLMAPARGGRSRESSWPQGSSREASWSGESYAGSQPVPQGGRYNEYSQEGSSSGTHSPISPMDLGEDQGPNGSRGNVSDFGMMRSSYSRASMSPNPEGSRRSLFGAGALVNGPQMHSRPSSTRLTGAPHTPHARVEIVPPLPLAPPPGAVISTDKSTLDFAPSSGINAEETLINMAAFEGRNAAFDGHYPPNTPRAGPSSSSSGGRSRSSGPRGSPSRLTSSSSSSEGPSPSSSSTGLPVRRSPLPPINTAHPHSSTSPFPLSSNPTSPLDKLQHQLALDARKSSASRS